MRFSRRLLRSWLGMGLAILFAFLAVMRIPQAAFGFVSSSIIRDNSQQSQLSALLAVNTPQEAIALFQEKLTCLKTEQIKIEDFNPEPAKIREIVRRLAKTEDFRKCIASNSITGVNPDTLVGVIFTSAIADKFAVVVVGAGVKESNDIAKKIEPSELIPEDVAEILSKLPDKQAKYFEDFLNGFSKAKVSSFIQDLPGNNDNIESEEITKLLQSLGINITKQPNTPSTALYEFLAELPQGVVDTITKSTKEDLNNIASNMAKFLPGNLYKILSDQPSLSQDQLITLSKQLGTSIGGTGYIPPNYKKAADSTITSLSVYRQQIPSEPRLSSGLLEKLSTSCFSKKGEIVENSYINSSSLRKRKNTIKLPSNISLDQVPVRPNPNVKVPVNIPLPETPNVKVPANIPLPETPNNPRICNLLDEGFTYDPVYESIARTVAYQRKDANGKDDSSVAPEGTILNNYTGVPDNIYVVDKVFNDIQNTGFFAVGLISKVNLPPVLTIKGTANILDIIDDINPIGVGAGQFKANVTEVEKWLIDITLNSNKNPLHAFPVITGHSLGGSLSQIFASDYTNRGGKLREVVTFNSPGVSEDTANWANLGNISKIRHYISSGDIVSLAGEKYLPGSWVKFHSDNPPGYTIFHYILAKHTDQQRLTSPDVVKFSPESSDSLSSGLFGYFLPPDKTWDEFTATLAMIPGGIAVDAIIFDREKVEKSRTLLGSLLFSVLHTLEAEEKITADFINMKHDIFKDYGDGVKETLKELREKHFKEAGETVIETQLKALNDFVEGSGNIILDASNYAVNIVNDVVVSNIKPIVEEVSNHVVQAAQSLGNDLNNVVNKGKIYAKNMLSKIGL